MANKATYKTDGKIPVSQQSTQGIPGPKKAKAKKAEGNTQPAPEFKQKYR